MTTDQLVHSYFTWLSWYFALPEPARLEVVSVDTVDVRTILLVWRSVSEQGSALRSSLWVKDADWRQRFHQGTPEA